MCHGKQKEHKGGDKHSKAVPYKREKNRRVYEDDDED